MSAMEALRQANTYQGSQGRRERSHKIIDSSDEDDDVVAIDKPVPNKQILREQTLPSSANNASRPASQESLHSKAARKDFFSEDGPNSARRSAAEQARLESRNPHGQSSLSPIHRLSQSQARPPSNQPPRPQAHPSLPTRPPYTQPVYGQQSSKDPSAMSLSSSDYDRFMKPGTGAFGSSQTKAGGSNSPFAKAAARQVVPSSHAYGYGQAGNTAVGGGMSNVPANHWMLAKLQAERQRAMQNGRSAQTAFSVKDDGDDRKAVNEDGEETEDFRRALNNIPLEASDFERVSADQAEADMRDLLSGAVGDGEEDAGFAEGEEVIEGFAKGMKLMPHQVRGVKWMRGRETGKKYGGILADDMGLGKTIQTLGNILQRPINATEKKAGYMKGTLIITPLSVMSQWAEELKLKTAPGKLKVLTYHGTGRHKHAGSFHKYDVVLTTYPTLASEFGSTAKKGAKGKKGKADVESEDEASASGSDSDSGGFGKSVKSKKATVAKPLFDNKWLRVVCDEAQNIKNRRTNAAKAAFGLKAKFRWCLTGTPIQNNVEELFSLFQFLRAKPLDDWTRFREQIIQPVKDGKAKLAMKRLHVLLKAIMLRRTKDATIDGKPILNLPGRFINIIQCSLDGSEREFYDALEKKQTLAFNKFLKRGTIMANYTSVLTLLLRLRQSTCHPELVTKSLSKDADALDSKAAKDGELDDGDGLAELLGGVQIEAGKKCDVCLAPLPSVTDTTCDDCQDLKRKARAHSVESDMGALPSSTKIRKMLELLSAVKERSEGKEKTIIFSQFTSFLDIIEPFLRKDGVKYVRYDGKMSKDERDVSINAIKSDKTVSVILISFKAGSTGLNLTCCNNVILLDLWWNPALEDQAYDRAHRLGQRLDVNIYKLTVIETVEDRILALQNQKKELAKAALSGEMVKGMKLDVNDLMALFKARPIGDKRRGGVDSDED